MEIKNIQEDDHMIFKDRFKDKVMILTGAARGIGRATALRAAQEGAKMVLADRLEEQGEETLKMIRDAGGEGIFLPLDLSIEENAQTLVQKAVETYGRVDICVNNAGVMGNPNPVHLLPKEDVDYTFANNFYTVYFCCKYELRQFIEQGDGGVIVNNASIAGMTGLEGNPAYNASKHAVNGLTKNLALDYQRYGIRVNSVNPSGTKTPMVEEAYEYVMKKREAAKAAGVDPKEIANMGGRKRMPIIDRQAEPEEQAAAILFLCSDDASYMTGATLQTDGGWTSF